MPITTIDVTTAIKEYYTKINEIINTLNTLNSNAITEDSTSTVSNKTLDKTNKYRTYDERYYSSGTVNNSSGDEHIMTFRTDKRIHNIDASLTTGTITIDLKKNGTSITFDSVLDITSTQTEFSVDESGDGYIDFAAGDTLEIEKTSASIPENLEIYFDIEDR